MPVSEGGKPDISRRHKLGTELAKSVKQALAVDTKNGNILWADAVSKELENVIVTFDILTDGKKAPICHQFVSCQMVFNIKMEQFRCKAGHVAESHMTKAPVTIKYLSILSRERVRIALMVAALNDLVVKAGEILKKVWTALGF